MPWKSALSSESILSSTSGDDNFTPTSSEVQNERWSMRDLIRQIKQTKGSKLDDALVIGIDFGTTYSGASWATIDDFENGQINLVTAWPVCGGEEGKAPTELFYDGDHCRWGYDIPFGADPVRWFKLLLLRDEDLDDEIRLSDYVLRARKMLKELEKSPVDVVADYLRGLWQHILNTIHKSRGKSITDIMAFHVVLTVPAIWKDYARKKMEEAATKAGILKRRQAGPTTLSFVPEPEAAALVTLWENGARVHKNQLYVICDAGGGTVDLITYRVGKKDPIELHEAAIGSGGLCGGIFVDEKFESICRRRLGLLWNNLSPTGVKSMTKNEWEDYIKRSYTGKDDDKEYIVDIPAEAFRGSQLTDMSRKPFIKDGRFHFSSSDIKEVFASTISSIEELIKGQIDSVEKTLNSPVEGIVLVGGLGSSPYLYNHLRGKYKEQGIRVIQATGLRPRTAICRGAIFKGFLDGPSIPSGVASAPVLVASTIARQSLGIECWLSYKPGVHDKEDAVWDDIEGAWLAKEQMIWLLRKGDNVTANKPLREDFYNTYHSEGYWDKYCGNHIATKTVILQCNLDVPPTKLNESVKRLCTLNHDYRHLTYDSLEDYEGNNGKKMKKLTFEIVMVPSGASTKFAVYHKGVKVGARNVQIEFQ